MYTDHKKSSNYESSTIKFVFDDTPTTYIQRTESYIQNDTFYDMKAR